MLNDTINGTVIEVGDYGTVVIILLEAGDGRTVPIPMDHRAFQHLLEGEACNSAELVGRSVAYDGDIVAFIEG